MADNDPPVIPTVVQVAPVPTAPVVVAAPLANPMKDNGVVDVRKCNGENFNDYLYEFMGIMEQLGLSSLIDASKAAIEVLTPEV